MEKNKETLLHSTLSRDVVRVQGKYQCVTKILRIGVSLQTKDVMLIDLTRIKIL